MAQTSWSEWMLFSSSPYHVTTFPFLFLSTFEILTPVKGIISWYTSYSLFPHPPPPTLSNSPIVHFPHDSKGAPSCSPALGWTPNCPDSWISLRPKVQLPCPCLAPASSFAVHISHADLFHALPSVAGPLLPPPSLDAWLPLTHSWLLYFSLLEIPPSSSQKDPSDPAPPPPFPSIYVACNSFSPLYHEIWSGRRCNLFCGCFGLVSEIGSCCIALAGFEFCRKPRLLALNLKPSASASRLLGLEAWVTC